MHQTLTKDAKGFVSGIVDYLRRDSAVSGDIPKVRELFRKVTSEASRQKYAQLETSVSLTPEEKRSLTQCLAKLVGHPIELVVRVNDKLLGGFRVTVGDWVVDTSLANELRQLSDSLLI
ncbi:F0F1 ATP synthase subunit delta [Candidatus Gottesmanbacteria bacterium]|nr:F0F1 ATP synthase subunit delta [Candidatus Gottesmanbacteria bacterium]